MRYGSASELFVKSSSAFYSLDSGNIADAANSDWVKGFFSSTGDVNPIIIKIID